ncbi:hypothetical protein LZ32DRAFT_276874 [Colletotrichum eremochloae]|nr:hypothetical protein LZ32DRAFT_276874 [Colletotrichum eremochloae]
MYAQTSHSLHSCLLIRRSLLVVDGVSADCLDAVHNEIVLENSSDGPKNSNSGIRPCRSSHLLKRPKACSARPWPLRQDPAPMPYTHTLPSALRLGGLASPGFQDSRHHDCSVASRLSALVMAHYHPTRPVPVVVVLDAWCLYCSRPLPPSTVIYTRPHLSHSTVFPCLTLLVISSLSFILFQHSKAELAWHASHYHTQTSSLICPFIHSLTHSSKSLHLRAISHSFRKVLW